MEHFDILFEDSDLIIVNKISAVPVQKEKTGDKTLEELVQEFLIERDSNKAIHVEACHRLDRRSSGIVILAKTQVMKQAIDELFRTRKIVKIYSAVVANKPNPESARLEHMLYWNGKTGKANAVDLPHAKATGGKKASLSYTLAASSDRYFLLAIELETGLSHQIRAQLSAIGCPVRGDLKYGAPRSLKNGLIMLHARSVEFEHPFTHTKTTILADYPKDEPLWAAAFANL